MGSRRKEYNKPQRGTKCTKTYFVFFEPFVAKLTLEAPLTLLPRSHSMTTPFETGTDGRVVPTKARTSMVDGFPYKEEVGGSNPSVPTKRNQFFAES